MIRILLLTPHPLLGACLHTVLSQSTDLAIVGVERDLDRAIERAEELRPDVIVANSRDTALEPVVLRLLKERLTATVILLNAADNRLRLYRSDRSEEWQMNQVEDLERAIRAE